MQKNFCHNFGWRRRVLPQKQWKKFFAFLYLLCPPICASQDFLLYCKFKANKKVLVNHIRVHVVHINHYFAKKQYCCFVMQSHFNKLKINAFTRLSVEFV